MSDENALRIYQKLDQMTKEMAEMNARIVRMEEKMNNNMDRCADRNEWMKTVERELDSLKDKASSIGGAKGLMAIIISVVAAVGAWTNK